VWVSLDDEKFDGQLILEDPQDGPAFRICSTESKRYKDAYDKAVQKYQMVIRSMKFIPWDLREKMENQALQAAITDWIGVHDEQGNRVDFSKEGVLEALEHEPEFRKRAVDVAGDLAYYKKADEEADTKNLLNSSASSLNGAGEAQTGRQDGETSLH
jgi:hypothetical protein